MVLGVGVVGPCRLRPSTASLGAGRGAWYRGRETCSQLLVYSPRGVTWLGKPIQPLGVGRVALMNSLLILYQVRLHLPHLLSLLALRSSKYIWQLFLRVSILVTTSQRFVFPRISNIEFFWSMISCSIVAGVHILLQMLPQVRRQRYHFV